MKPWINLLPLRILDWKAEAVWFIIASLVLLSQLLYPRDLLSGLSSCVKIYVRSRCPHLSETAGPWPKVRVETYGAASKDISQTLVLAVLLQKVLWFRCWSADQMSKRPWLTLRTLSVGRVPFFPSLKEGEGSTPQARSFM